MREREIFDAALAIANSAERSAYLVPFDFGNFRFSYAYAAPVFARR